MGFFDSLFRSGKPAAASPDALREALFEAAALADPRELERLCRANQAAIVEHFASWQQVPQAIRARPDALQRYAHGLIGVAQLFAEVLGEPELLERLSGPRESNPMAQWEEALTQARALMDQVRFEQALPLLAATVPRMQTLEGSGSQRYLPIACGFIAECFFHLGRAQDALEHASLALELCERHGDADGVLAYLRQLYEIHRYLGRSEAAADYAARLATVLRARGNETEASWFAKQAKLVRAGEPLNRVVVQIGAQRYECDALPRLESGRAQFVFERNRIALRCADAAVERGEQLGSAGDFAGALAALRDAARADRFDPRPRYLAGFTLLHLGRYAEAVEEYRATDELAPGWYHCRADRFVAEELAARRIDDRAFAAWVALEDGAGAPSEKLALAETGLGAYPGFAPFHLQRGRALAALGRDQLAERALRDGLRASPDVGTRTCLLFEFAQRVQGAERAALLDEAVTLDGDRVAAAMARLQRAAT